MSFRGNNQYKEKPTVDTRQNPASDTSDSEFDNVSEAGSGDNQEDDAVVPGKFKISRSKAIRMNLTDIRDDKDNLKLMIVDTIYHAKAHLKKGVIKACGKIVESWGVNVPQEFIPYNLNGNKLYNSYTKIMNSVADALRENGGVVNFGVTNKGHSAEPEYFKVAKKIICGLKLLVYDYIYVDTLLHACFVRTLLGAAHST